VEKLSWILIFRNIVRFKSTFFINLLGLSLGLVCTLLIFLWVNDELSIDKFHHFGDRLLRVMENQHNAETILTIEKTPALLAESLKESYPEIKYAVPSSGIFDEFTLSLDQIHLSAAGQFAGKDYFNAFSYEFIQGDRVRALEDKNAIVISDEMANNLFGSTDVIGKVIVWQTSYAKSEAKITGVFKTIGSNSSHQFDMVLPFELFKDIERDYIHWGNNNARTYLVINEGVDASQINAKITNFIKERSNKSNVTLFVQPYANYYLYGSYENGVLVGGRIEYVFLLSIIACLVLVVACVNFMNLSTAKATRRIKEVGIKKAIGASRRMLIWQFMGESMLVTLAAFIIANVIVYLLLPVFNTITGKTLALVYSERMVLGSLVILLFTGLVSGSYPALYLSGFNPAAVLKGRISSSVGEVWLRKALVIFQFTVSIVFIVLVVVVYRQIQFIQGKNLGYDKDNVVCITAEGNVTEHLETILAEIKRLPGVVNSSSMATSIVGGGHGTISVSWPGKNPKDIFYFESARVNYDLIETLGIEMKSGRPFDRGFPSDNAAIIFNEAAVALMNFDDPVGERVSLWGTERTIIGVCHNFHYESLHENVKPLFFIIEPKDSQLLMVKLKGDQTAATLKDLQGVYESINPGFAFRYNFLEHDYQALHASETKVGELSKYFAGFTILISCLGLFGLVAFTVEKRQKEMSIRKVLGANEFTVIFLLSRDFTLMVVSAILIALPISFFMMKQWLNGFAYRIDLHWTYFAGAGLAALLVTWLTAGAQAIKAGLSKPLKSLRAD
jgi:putative ABC transport system permease protein